MSRFLALALLLPALALAQLRTIPDAAVRGEIRHVAEMQVELDGKPQRLSPGVQIRDAHNRLILPVYLSDKADVRYLLDGDGMVHRVWILTAQEKAAAPTPASPFPR